MAKEMLVTSKKYRISSEAKNSKGFKVRTSGIDLSEYNNNPLLIWLHNLVKGESKSEILGLGNVVDIERIDGEIWGKLAFDPNDEFAVKLFHKYENGTYRMVSAGLVPLKWEKDANGELWLVKSKLKEVSCAEIGSNPESFGVELYENTEGLVRLSFKSIKSKNEELFKTENMKTIQLGAAHLALLKLSADSDDVAAQNAFEGLVKLSETQAVTITQKENAIIKLQGEFDVLKTEKEALEKTQEEEKIETLCEGGVNDRKYTKDQKAHYVKLANLDFDSTKALIDSMPSQGEVSTLLNADGTDTEVGDLVKLSYDELHKSDKLVVLKEKAPEVFKQKFKAKYGVDYKE